MAKLTNSFEMVVSEKVNGKYAPRGKVTVFYPTLADFGLDASIKEQTEEGFPVYSDDKNDWLFSALLAAVRANARNKIEIVNSNVQCKDGLSIADTMEALIEGGTAGGNGGKALQDIRDFINAFKAHMAKSGKSSNVQAAVVAFAQRPDTIGLVEDADKRAKISAYVADFVATVSEEDATRWNRRIMQIADMCEASSALDAEDF